MPHGIKSLSSKLNCHQCQLVNSCIPMGLTRIELDKFISIIHSKFELTFGKALCKAGTRAKYIFAIQGGSIKDSILCKDGFEQVTDFYLPGEIIGLDAIDTGFYTADSVALETTKVCAIPLSDLMTLSHQIPALQQRMMKSLSQKLMERTHSYILQHHHAEQRLIAFLLNLSYRFKHRGHSATNYRLSMSRQDIGSYLHLTIETVSRVFTKLQQEKLLSVNKKKILLNDLTELKKRCVNIN